MTASEKILFSIITVTFNSAATLRVTIESVINQNHKELEYILIDGASTDNTLSIIESYQDKINKLVSEPDRGIYDAFNKGLKVATGDVIGFINSDDHYYNESSLEEVASFFRDHPDCDACYGNILMVGTDKKIRRKWRSRQPSTCSYYLGWMPPHPSFFVKKSVFDRLGGFSLSLDIASDYELMLRFLVKNKIKCGYIDKYLVTMTAGGVSNKSLKNIVKANWEVYKAWQFNGLRFGFLCPILKPLRKICQLL